MPWLVFLGKKSWKNPILTGLLAYIPIRGRRLLHIWGSKKFQSILWRHKKHFCYVIPVVFRDFCLPGKAFEICRKDFPSLPLAMWWNSSQIPTSAICWPRATNWPTGLARSFWHFPKAAMFKVHTIGDAERNFEDFLCCFSVDTFLPFLGKLKVWKEQTKPKHALPNVCRDLMTTTTTTFSTFGSNLSADDSGIWTQEMGRCNFQFFFNENISFYCKK